MIIIYPHDQHIVFVLPPGLNVYMLSYSHVVKK